MKLNDSKKTIYIPTKKHVLLFIIAFIGAILFFFEHFEETPISISDVKVSKNFNQEKSEVGYLGPGFTLRNLKGNYESLEDYRGQVVILNFWATWSAPCREEIPVFIELQQKFQSQGLQFVGIALQQAEEVRDFIEEYNVNYPSLIGGDEVIKIASQLGNNIGAIPYTVMINTEGKNESTHRRPLTKEEADAAIKNFL